MSILRFYNAHIVDPSQSIDGLGYVDIAGGKISDLQLGQPADNDACDKVTDCKGVVLAPGLVDMRVQSADPGAEHLESLSTLLAAAAKGGITALACLPTTRPVIDEASAIDSMCLRASRIGGPRLSAYGAATKGLLGPEMSILPREKYLGKLRGNDQL